MSDRFVPLGTPSLGGEGQYEGYSIKFKPGKYGAVRAILYDEDGYLVDEIVGASFTDAYTTAEIEWPGARWKNKEEE
jgi:hypothetical protein